MSDAWMTVLITGMATMAIKGAGPVLAGGRDVPARYLGVVEMLAPAVLAALVATQVFDGGRSLVVDERVAGMGVAVGLLALRAPTLAVVVGAAVATALARAL
jgi:uncharacterized membrane protein